MAISYPDRRNTGTCPSISLLPYRVGNSSAKPPAGRARPSARFQNSLPSPLFHRTNDFQLRQRGGLAFRLTDQCHPHETTADGHCRLIAADSLIGGGLRLVRQQLPVPAPSSDTSISITPVAARGKVSLVLPTVTIRSKSTRSHGFLSPSAACQNVSVLPSLARRPLCPGASLLARVGFSRPKRDDRLTFVRR